MQNYAILFSFNTTTLFPYSFTLYKKVGRVMIKSGGLYGNFSEEIKSKNYHHPHPFFKKENPHIIFISSGATNDL